jgi:hypothetical protein
MSETYQGAGRLGVIPPNLADDLIGLAVLRNKTIHENVIVDEQLRVYARLLVVICAGYAANEAFLRLLTPRDPLAISEPVVIDREFIGKLLRRRDTDAARRGLSRLATDSTAPRYVVSRRAAEGFLRMVRATRSTGD